MPQQSGLFSLPPYLNFKTLESRFIREFNLFRKRPISGEVRLEFAKSKWADLMELMCVAVVAEHLHRKHGANVYCHFYKPRLQKIARPDEAEFSRFCQGMKLVQFLRDRGHRTNIEQEETKAGYRLLPITDLGHKDLGELLGDIRNVINRYYYGRVSADQIYSLVEALVFEPSENAQMHAYDVTSASSVVCRAVAIRRFPVTKTARGRDVRMRLKYNPYWLWRLVRQYPDADFVDIAVVDGGVGIYSRLGRTHEAYIRERKLAEDPTELNCLKWVISPERSTHLPDTKRGFGLYRLVEHVVKGWGGAFLLRSGHSQVIRLPGEDENYTEPVDDGQLSIFPGTQIRVLIPVVRRHLEVLRVMRDVDSKIGAGKWQSPMST